MITQVCLSFDDLFIKYVTWIGRHSRVKESVSFGKRKTKRLLFVQISVLSPFSEHGLQRAHD